MKTFPIFEFLVIFIILNLDHELLNVTVGLFSFFYDVDLQGAQFGSEKGKILSIPWKGYFYILRIWNDYFLVNFKAILLVKKLEADAILVINFTLREYLFHARHKTLSVVF